ncbi:MAG: YicC family protein [Magnetococcales bacterium]|nr:YicC family protein [Magnetococcales bacterium]
MPNSMTGFAEASASYGNLRLVWRLRSVNHRYLDLAFRRPGHWPGNWHDLEGQATRQLQNHFSRGHLDCELHLTTETELQQKLELDQTLLQELLRLEAELMTAAGDGSGRTPIPVDRLLAWPGLVRERKLTEEEGQGLQQAALTLLEETASQLAATRATEGQALTTVVQQLLTQLSELLAAVEALLPTLRHEQKRQLHNRVSELTGTTVDRNELAREVAILLNRVDIAEEVERLRMHIKELHVLLTGPEAVGRRLDFFCQELNREANTLCSKSQNSHLTRLGVEMKLVVEKLREQAQNLE